MRSLGRMGAHRWTVTLLGTGCTKAARGRAHDAAMEGRPSRCGRQHRDVPVIGRRQVKSPVYIAGARMSSPNSCMVVCVLLTSEKRSQNGDMVPLGGGRGGRQVAKGKSMEGRERRPRGQGQTEGDVACRPPGLWNRTSHGAFLLLRRRHVSRRAARMREALRGGHR